jgi:hypothetical protein
MKNMGYGVLLILTILFTLAAISTLIPQSAASKDSMLDYKAHCSFTPISTVICLGVAGFLCRLRNKMFSE